MMLVSLNLNLESLSNAQPKIKITGVSQFQNTKWTYILQVFFFNVFHWNWNIKSKVKHKKYSEYNFREQITNLFNKEPVFRVGEGKPDQVMQI